MVVAAVVAAVVVPVAVLLRLQTCSTWVSSSFSKCNSRCRISSSSS